MFLVINTNIAVCDDPSQISYHSMARQIKTNKLSRHPRVSDKILFTQRNSKTRCGFYTYRNITQNKKVAFFNSHNYILKIKIWYRWVIMILPYINFNVPAQLDVTFVALQRKPCLTLSLSSTGTVLCCSLQIRKAARKSVTFIQIY